MKHVFPGVGRRCRRCDQVYFLTTGCPGPMWWYALRGAAGVDEVRTLLYGPALRVAVYTKLAGFDYRDGYGWYQELEE